MFPFWDGVLAPIIEATGAQRVLEIGALRGETTVQMLKWLGPDAELHVIDPVPAFDPSDHEREFPGRYLFHRRLSLDVLPELPAFDVALIDGDHNWYTVHNELQAIAATSKAAGRPLPVLILHDVGWPYGRRDLYYDPDTIPEEFRQEYAKAGIVRGESALRSRGGLNPTMFNATHEGGPRNGVMTALDDFVAEHAVPSRCLVIPIYFGLAIVADEERLAASPGIVELLDRFESDDDAHQLLELAEDTRLEAMVMQHAIYYSAEQRIDRAASRYLDLLKGSLLDEHYIENELRMDLLVRNVTTRLQPQPMILRDPMRQLRPAARRALAARRSGDRGPKAEDDPWSGYFPYSSMGRVRLDALQARLDTVRTESVKGDFVECGTGRGGGGIFLRGYLDAFEMMARTVWIASRFRATVDPPAEDDAADGADSADSAVATPPGGAGATPDDEPMTVDRLLGDLRADLNNVRDAFARFDLLDDRVKFLVGPFAATLPDAEIDDVAFLLIGREAAGSVGEILDQLYDRVALGGFVFVDGFPEVEAEVTAFFEARGVTDQLERVDWSSATWRKTEHRPAGDAASVAPDVARQHPPLARPLARPAKALSVVVVFYNMQREAARTLHSLSRAYQQQIEDLDYEVIVVDNGSDPDQRLDKKYVRSFGPEFRFVDMGAEATPSPIPALNKGVELSRGANIALMIDGAHVLTPGVLHFAMTGLSAYPSSLVVTQQWYLGPGQQGDTVEHGYTTDVEDRLFDEIEWPVDGYRLFDIGHFIGERDWLDGLWESNCIVVPRKLLEQVGAFDESFAMPGGGYANLELYERLGASPEVTVTTMLGEGSFHQVHGGTTTNLADPAERHRRIASYSEHYQDLRGRGFVGHRKRLHYVGTMFDEAARTRPRRHVAPNFFVRGSQEGRDGRPSTPEAVPQELQTEFLEALWRSLAWKETRWLGRKVNKLPTDLFAYQELVVKLRPDFIIDTATGGAGRALFLASICDLVDHGRVVSIDRNASTKLPPHDRITYVPGDPLDESVAARVGELVNHNCLVILAGCRPANQTSREFNLYSEYVPVGSYVIVEETIVNGHPVWANFGPGPSEAVKGIVESRGEFATDQDMERYHLTFNPNGYLKRVR